jgi:hypothetical protein
MKKNTSKKFLNIKILTSLGTIFSMSALAFQYNVKKGDNLSKIAASHNPGPIYGSKGSLEKILSLNPSIKNKNLIYPGQILKLENPLEKVNDQDRIPAQEGPLVNPSPFSAFNSFSTLSVLPKIKYQRISGKDESTNASAKLYSSDSIGVDLDWLLHWSEEFTSVIGFRYSSLKYQDISNRTLLDKSVSSAGISFGVQYKISQRTSIYSSLDFGSHAYLYAPSASTIRVDKGNAFSNKSGVKLTLADLGPVQFKTFGGVSVLAPTKVDTYNSKLGYSGHLGLELSHTLKSGNRIKGVLEIDHGQLDTKSVGQSHDNMSLGIGMEWRLE